MKELKFKNAFASSLYGAVFISVGVIILFLAGIIGTLIFDTVNDVYLLLKIFCPIIPSILLIEIFVLILNPNIIVTENEIMKCRGKKIKWSIKREEIQECIYTTMKWYMFIDPISSINAFNLQFKIINKGVSRNYCSLSLKQVKKIQEIYNYPVRIINTIYEQ